MLRDGGVRLSGWQRAAVVVGSAVGALLDPRRADIIAALGETTGKPAFEMVLQRMKKSPEGTDFVYEEHEDGQLCYPHGFHGVDKAGRPIHITYLAEPDCSKMMKVTTVDRFMKYYIQECEKMVVEKFPACSAIANKPIDSIVEIFLVPTNTKCDFKSAMYSNYLAFRTAKVRFTYYRQTEHQVFYLNTRKGFKLFNRLLGWFDDPRQRPEGTYALGKDFRNKLLEFIDEDQLPTFLGGSCTCPGKGGCLRFEKGPWVDPKTMQQAKDKYAEMVLNKRKELPETMQIIPDTVQLQQLPSYLDSALSLGTTCHKCTKLENNINLLSSKMDRLQKKLDQLLLPQEKANTKTTQSSLK